MKTQCPHCGHVFPIPGEYLTQDVKCVVCKKMFPVQPFHVLAPIEPHKFPAKGADLISRLWKNTPRPFKLGFLSTLGVLSAALLTFYVYGHLILPARRSQPIHHAIAQLAEHKLFPTTTLPRRGILRGRSLDEYRFYPDASYAWPYLSLWTDESAAIVGLSASWYSDNHGEPTYIPSPDDPDGLASHFRYACVLDGFLLLLGPRAKSGLASIPTYKRNRSIYAQHHWRNWQIDLSRDPKLISPARYHAHLTQRTASQSDFPADPNVYLSTMTAIAW